MGHFRDLIHHSFPREFSALQNYDYSLSDVNIMCDRGSNFQKAFKGSNTLFCFGHRLNNVLKRSFFQNQRKKKASRVDHGLTAASAAVTTTIASTSSGIDSEEDIYTDDSDGTSDEDFELTTAMPVLRRKKGQCQSSSHIFSITD